MTVDGSCAEERVFIYSEMQQCSFRMRFHAGCNPPPNSPHTPTPPCCTHALTHTYKYPPPVLLISTLKLQSPGLIKNGKCVIGEEGFGPVQGQSGLHCARGWLGRSQQRAHSARLPAWPRRSYQSQHRSPRKGSWKQRDCVM